MARADVPSWSSFPPDAEAAQQVHDVMVICWRRRAATGDPVKQVGVVTVEQGLEPAQLCGAQPTASAIGERAENQVDLLRAAMPAAKHQALAAQLEFPVWRTGSDIEIAH